MKWISLWSNTILGITSTLSQSNHTEWYISQAKYRLLGGFRGGVEVQERKSVKLHECSCLDARGPLDVEKKGRASAYKKGQEFPVSLEPWLLENPYLE